MQQRSIKLKRNEEKVVPFIWINGAESEVSFESDLTEENTRLHLVGLFLGTGSHKITFNTAISHTAHNTVSRTTIRAVFLDQADFNNDGLVRINRGAKNADGYFTSKILLFDDATGRSVPSLEIDENELKAGHASTIGRPDAEQLFYMKSRGIGEKEAQKLIIAGFFQPVIQLIPKVQQRNVQEKLTMVLSGMSGPISERV